MGSLLPTVTVCVVCSWSGPFGGVWLDDNSIVVRNGCDRSLLASVTAKVDRPGLSEIGLSGTNNMANLERMFPVVTRYEDIPFSW